MQDEVVKSAYKRVRVDGIRVCKTWCDRVFMLVWRIGSILVPARLCAQLSADMWCTAGSTTFCAVYGTTAA